MTQLPLPMLFMILSIHNFHAQAQYFSYSAALVNFICMNYLGAFTNLRYLRQLSTPFLFVDALINTTIIWYRNFYFKWCVLSKETWVGFLTFVLTYRHFVMTISNYEQDPYFFSFSNCVTALFIPYNPFYTCPPHG